MLISCLKLLIRKLNVKLLDIYIYSICSLIVSRISAKKSLLLCFGEQLLYISTPYRILKSNSLLRLALQGTNFVPLDKQAIEFLVKYKLPYTLPESYVTDEDLTFAANLARDISISWYLPFEDRFSYRNFFLPELDFEGLRWTFMNATYLQSVILRMTNCPGVKFLFTEGQTVSVTTKIGINLWQHITNQSEDKNSASIKAVAQDNKFHLPNGIPKSKKWFICDASEVFRYIDLIKHIHSARKTSISMIIVGTATEKDMESLISLGIDVITWKSPESFINGFSCADESTFILETREIFDAKVQEILEACRHDILERENGLWRAYKKWMDLWIDFIEMHKPDYILSSPWTYLPNSIPLAAAQAAKTKTFVVPHGKYWRPDIYPFMFESFSILTDSRLHETMCKTVYDDLKIVKVNNLYLEREWDFHNYKLANKNSSPRNILVLTNPVMLSDVRFLGLNIQCAIDAIKWLSDLSATEGYHLLYKGHPYDGNLELHEIARVDTEKSVLPPSASLDDALNLCEIVVSINYPFAAPLHAIKSGKPTVFLHNDATFLNSAPQKPTMKALNDLLFPVAYDLNSLSFIINQFFDDLDFANYIKTVQKKFSDEWLNSYSDVDIADYLISSA